MAKNIVILGGGTGGTMVANHLAKGLKHDIKKGDVKITMITNAEEHIYQPGWLFVAFGLQHPEHYIKKQRAITHPSINLVIAEATKIDKDKKVVHTNKGDFSYDYLVIGTGAVPRFDLIPGLPEAGDDFYSPEGALKLREKITNFKGGKILITMGMPHKCPVAPIEFYLMAHEFFEKKGIRDKVELVYTYPLETVHSAANVAAWYKPQMEKRNIRYVTEFVPAKVDPQKKILYSKDGKEESFDLLVSIPPHRGAKVIFDSGLGNEMGFIPVNQYTLKAINDNYIYVIGDATALQISKAGSTAHYESEYVAKNIEQELHGQTPTNFYDGKVFCFIEAGLEEGTYINMDYNHPPNPVPQSAMIHWFKHAFNEMYWMTARGLL
ncbi:NAD(P)/FAD-dependent oxidoreductase [Tepidibacillus fermentans]|uniref:Sulfide:quinone oxidoreductase n=1 Tax=Tepidibacillus fermentans TaxID=1281767 RepID=A0A4R3KIV1_9BACI|nr:FAD/NAD(P)-binding oxidoreductase [Tepidibacillus fermentans]TCS83547.1 sulfide:quinone oxidoreductase [Tepidibacillus fermentans]